MRALEGRVALVTGGSRGIGQATARRLVSDGATVLVGDLPTVLASNPADDDIIDYREFDITDESSVDALLRGIEQLHGRLDILVNNAGLHLNCQFDAVTKEAWQRLMSVNLEGLYFLTQRAIRALETSTCAAIINIASTSAFVSSPGQSVYEISKAGVAMLTRSLAKELAPRGIRVNAVAPGLIDTEMTRTLFGSREKMDARVQLKCPTQRAGRPEEIAGAVAFLASDDAAYMLGEILVVDGGWLLGGA